MLAIIVVNYKNENKTISYVKNELVKINISHIVVIVNNAANPESNKTLINGLNAQLIEDIAIRPNINEKIFIVSHPDNLGFAKGNNLGAAFSNQYFNISHFLFSNNDIQLINSDVVEQLIKKIDSLPNIGLIGPKVLGLDGKNQSPEPYSSFWNRYIWIYWSTPFLSAKRKKSIFKLDYSETAKEGIHYKVMGSFFMVKSIDFMKCGMMDPNTFLYGEEVILSERLKAIGKKVYYYPNVAVIHEHSQTISTHLNEDNKTMKQFFSECYYYNTYKNVSSLSILIGKFSINWYLKLKKMKV